MGSSRGSRERGEANWAPERLEEERVRGKRGRGSSGALRSFLAWQGHASLGTMGLSQHGGGAWTSQMGFPGAHRHAASVGHNLEKEDKVQSTVSACEGGAHHGHSCPHGTQDQSSMSDT